ncbi:uncharacterized protein [Mytilus edulis]|uniref:uncharacterized protein n=1 Tax=Mytilus edulis TaxID=6550 RepID=UPI0039F07757
MNRNSKNDGKDDEQNVRGLRKISYWEKYGVKRFPYPGRRRFTPSLYQSEDVGIAISNDVFGLTISQFERMYKACLDRRKSREQYIMNLRYSDKTSDEYMEYLQDSTDNNKDDMSWTAKNLKERNLYEHLVNEAGTEIDIRNRQKLFMTNDMIHNAILRQSVLKITKISSGSLAEGIDLPGSDIDVMYVIEEADAIRDVRNIKHSVQQTTLLMENDNDHPGFTRVRLIAGGDGESFFIQPECFESTIQGLYLAVNSFVNNINKKIPNVKLSSHGPCLSDYDQSVDIAFCLRSKYLPYNALPWASRHRLQWPPNSVIDKIKNNGCLLVPIGPSTLPYCNILWRLSFSVAEKQLVHSFNFTQLLCYCLLKLTLKHIINTNKHAEGLLCSYFLKTALFWVSEEVDIDTFQVSKLYSCFCRCLSKIIFWVNNCYCPNYFIPEHNMFLGKINKENNKMLINALYKIKCDGIDRLIHSVFLCENGHHRLLSTQRETSFIMLDLLFYRISDADIGEMNDISVCLKLLVFIEDLLKSKTYSFIVDVCKYHHAQMSQYTAQLLPAPAVTTERYKTHKRYHRYLQNGIKTDAVSGWVLYASFYYVTGQFNVTLRLTDYILSRCSTDMVPMFSQNYQDRHIKYYINRVHSTITLCDKMKMAVVSDVCYIKQSSLIPNELQLEVNDYNLLIPPTVMSHCLRFLCYYHVGDTNKRQQSLSDLESTVSFISTTTLSNSITILGICFELSGDKNTAYQCYEEALKSYGHICSTAEARKLQLLID